MKPDEGPLSRWARRKATSQLERQRSRSGAAPALAEEPTAVPATTGSAADEPTPGDSPSESTAPPDLPDIETLEADSDFTVFMRDGVPKELRNLALRKLWRSDPVLANLDGLNDYDEDYTISESLVKGLKSAYEAGKGSPEEDVENEVESSQEDTAEAPAAADRPTAEEDVQEVEDGDREAIPDPGEKEPKPSGGAA